MTPNGLQNIESLRPGDAVLSPGPHRSVRVAVVTRSMMSSARSISHLRLSNGTTVAATSEHPVLARSGWVNIGEVRVGMELRTKAGYSAVASIDELTGAWDVFNVEVSPTATYFANGVVVHNKSIDTGSWIRWEAVRGRWVGRSDTGNARVVLLLPDDDGQLNGVPPRELTSRAAHDQTESEFVFRRFSPDADGFWLIFERRETPGEHVRIRCSNPDPDGAVRGVITGLGSGEIQVKMRRVADTVPNQGSKE